MLFMASYIIAEIGTSHRGDLKRADELIHAAKEAGADSAKFQMVIAHEIIHPETGVVPLPGGDIGLFDQFRQLEEKEDFYFRLKELCQKRDISFMATPFGSRTAQWLNRLEPEYIKVASPELNHLPLLKQLSEYGRKMILSTGVSLLADIERALAICRPLPVTLLHCITAYPAPPEEFNLSLIPLYRKLFGCETGLSDHSSDPCLVPMTAVTQGMSMLEKHICLERGRDGLDDPFALAPEDFLLMVQSVRYMESLDSDEQQRCLKERFEDDKISRILGNGEKKLAPSEEENYGRTNRSIHTLKLLKAGTRLTIDNTALLRTEKKLRPGIEPLYYPEILGRKLTRTVPSGEGIRWKDLLCE